VRVHGNVHLTDAEVLAIAGVREGDALGPGTIEAIAARLSASRRFETVDVRKRYRSLTDASDVAIILVVHERPASARPGRISGRGRSPARRARPRDGWPAR
jgi:outer membrane protein assembly factor BamA